MVAAAHAVDLVPDDPQGPTHRRQIGVLRLPPDPGPPLDGARDPAIAVQHPGGDAAGHVVAPGHREAPVPSGDLGVAAVLVVHVHLGVERRAVERERPGHDPARRTPTRFPHDQRGVILPHRDGRVVLRPGRRLGHPGRSCGLRP